MPMLVISGVNPVSSLGHGRGRLHALPDQRGMMSSLALYSHTLLDPDDLPAVIDRAFSVLTSGRPGPVHIEIPTDVMAARIAIPPRRRAAALKPTASETGLKAAADLCAAAGSVVLLIGGGAIEAEGDVLKLAEALDAPVVSTTNARGMLAGHPLLVPASPSLKSVRTLISGADLVLAIGTEFGQTDYDMYVDNGFPAIEKLVRIDIDHAQLARGPATELAILSAAKDAVSRLAKLVQRHEPAGGVVRAQAARNAAFAELTEKMRAEIGIIGSIYRALPDCTIVGDSTQVIYAGNLFCEAPRKRSWFNAATGFGALGYGAPAAIGAAVGEPTRPVICLTGDGGFQFSLAEMGSAVDAGARVTFLVWNNDGYQEIETAMIEAGVTPEGVKPSAPDFLLAAQAYGIPAVRLDHIDALCDALKAAARRNGPSLIEIHETRTKGAKGLTT
jgi:acetolactate synthase I/II/III large subunit